MRILLLSCADSIHTVRWANEFVQRQHEVLLVSNKDHVLKDNIDKNVTIKYLKFSGTKAYYLNAFQLHNIYKKYKPDIVSVHYASGYGTLARIARIKPCVLSVWGSDVYVFPKKNFVTKFLLKKNVKYAKVIASTSKVMLSELSKIVNITKKKCVITPFGIDTSFFKPSGLKYPIADNKFVFGSVKKLTYLYGIDYLIRAFKIVHDRWLAERNGLEPFLFLCGNGENIEDFKKLALDYDLGECVCIRDYVEHNLVPSILRSIDVFCLSSLSESFGVSALEAMSCAKPVIATDADGFLEIIRDESLGIIVPKKDTEAMAEKMWYLYTHPDERKKIGKNAREYAVNNFEWKKSASSLLDAFEELLTIR